MTPETQPNTSPFADSVDEIRAIGGPFCGEAFRITKRQEYYRLSTEALERSTFVSRDGRVIERTSEAKAWSVQVPGRTHIYQRKPKALVHFRIEGK